MSGFVPHRTFERVSPPARASSSSSPRAMFESPMGHSRWMTPDAEFGRPLERRSYFHSSNDNNENNKKDKDVQEKKGEKEEEERSILIRSEAREAMLQAGMNAKEVEHIISGLVTGRREMNYPTPLPYHSQSQQKTHPHQQQTVKATSTPTHHISYNNPRRVGLHNSPRMITHHNSPRMITHHNSPRMITHHNPHNSPIIMSRHNSPGLMSHYNSPTMMSRHNSPRMMSQHNSLLYSVSASSSSASVRTHVDIRLSSTFSTCSPTISSPCGLFSTPSSSSLPLPLPFPTSSTSVGIEIMKSEGHGRGDYANQAEQKKNTETSYYAQKETNNPEAEEEDKEEQTSRGHLEESGGSRLSTASSHWGNAGNTQDLPVAKFGNESEKDETRIKDESFDRHQKRNAAEERKRENNSTKIDKREVKTYQPLQKQQKKRDNNKSHEEEKKTSQTEIGHEEEKSYNNSESKQLPEKSEANYISHSSSLHNDEDLSYQASKGEIYQKRSHTIPAKFPLYSAAGRGGLHEEVTTQKKEDQHAKLEINEQQPLRHRPEDKNELETSSSNSSSSAAEFGNSSIRDDNVTANSKDSSSNDKCGNVSITSTPCDIDDDEGNGVALLSSKGQTRDNNVTANSKDSNSRSDCRNVSITSTPCEVDDEEENGVAREETRYYESKSQISIPSCDSPINSPEIPPDSSPRSITPIPPYTSKTPPPSSPRSTTPNPLSSCKTPPTSSPRSTTPNPPYTSKTPPTSSPRSTTPDPISSLRASATSSPRSTTPNRLSSLKASATSPPRSTTPNPLSSLRASATSPPRSTTPNPLSSSKTPRTSPPSSPTPNPLSSYKTPPSSSPGSTTPKPPSRSTTPPTSPPGSSTPKPLSSYKTLPASSPLSTTPDPPPTLTPRPTTPSELLPPSASPSSATAEEEDSRKHDILLDSLFASTVKEKEKTDDEDSDSNEPRQLQPISSPPVISSANSFDELPVKGLHDPNSFSAATAPEDGMAAQQRLPCPKCGRFFHCDRLAKHVAICTKIQSRIKQPKYRTKQKPSASQLPSSTKNQSSPPSVPTSSTSSSSLASSSKPLNQKRVSVASHPAATASADSASHPYKPSQQHENHPHPPLYRRHAPPHPNLQTHQPTTTSSSSHPSSLRPSSPSRSTTAKTIDSPSKQGKPKPCLDVNPPPSPSPSYISSCSFVSCGGLNEDANNTTPSGDSNNNQTFYTPFLRPLKPIGMSEEGGGDGSGEHNHNNSSNNQNSKEEPFSLLPKPSRPQRGRTRLTRCSSRPSLILHEPSEAVDDEKETEEKRAETPLPSELHELTKHPKTESSDINILKCDHQTSTAAEDDNKEEGKREKTEEGGGGSKDDTGTVDGEEISSPTTSPPTEERNRKRGSTLNSSNLSEVARVSLGERWKVDASKTCPYCARKFNPRAIARHVDICAGIRHRPKNPYSQHAASPSPVSSSATLSTSMSHSHSSLNHLSPSPRPYTPHTTYQKPAVLAPSRSTRTSISPTKSITPTNQNRFHHYATATFSNPRSPPPSNSADIAEIPETPNDDFHSVSTTKTTPAAGLHSASFTSLSFSNPASSTAGDLRPTSVSPTARSSVSSIVRSSSISPISPSIRSSSISPNVQTLPKTKRGRKSEEEKEVKDTGGSPLSVGGRTTHREKEEKKRESWDSTAVRTTTNVGRYNASPRRISSYRRKSRPGEEDEKTPRPRTPMTTKESGSTLRPSSPKTTKEDEKTPRPSSPKTTKEDEKTPRPSSPKTTKEDEKTPRPRTPITTKEDEKTPRPRTPITTKEDEKTPRPRAPTTARSGSVTVRQNHPLPRRNSHYSCPDTDPLRPGSPSSRLRQLSSAPASSSSTIPPSSPLVDDISASSHRGLSKVSPKGMQMRRKSNLLEISRDSQEPSSSVIPFPPSPSSSPPPSPSVALRESSSYSSSSPAPMTNIPSTRLRSPTYHPSRSRRNPNNPKNTTESSIPLPPPLPSHSTFISPQADPPLMIDDTVPDDRVAPQEEEFQHREKYGEESTAIAAASSVTQIPNIEAISQRSNESTPSLGNGQNRISLEEQSRRRSSRGGHRNPLAPSQLRSRGNPLEKSAEATKEGMTSPTTTTKTNKPNTTTSGTERRSSLIQMKKKTMIPTRIRIVEPSTPSQTKDIGRRKEEECHGEEGRGRGDRDRAVSGGRGDRDKAESGGRVDRDRAEEGKGGGDKAMGGRGGDKYGAESGGRGDRVEEGRGGDRGKGESDRDKAEGGRDRDRGERERGEDMGEGGKGGDRNKAEGGGRDKYRAEGGRGADSYRGEGGRGGDRGKGGRRGDRNGADYEQHERSTAERLDREKLKEKLIVEVTSLENRPQFYMNTTSYSPSVSFAVSSSTPCSSSSHASALSASSTSPCASPITSVPSSFSIPHTVNSSSSSIPSQVQPSFSPSIFSPLPTPKKVLLVSPKMQSSPTADMKDTFQPSSYSSPLSPPSSSIPPYPSQLSPSPFYLHNNQSHMCHPSSYPSANYPNLSIHPNSNLTLKQPQVNIQITAGSKSPRSVLPTLSFSSRNSSPTKHPEVSLGVVSGAELTTSPFRHIPSPKYLRQSNYTSTEIQFSHSTEQAISHPTNQQFSPALTSSPCSLKSANLIPKSILSFTATASSSDFPHSHPQQRSATTIELAPGASSSFSSSSGETLIKELKDFKSHSSPFSQRSPQKMQHFSVPSYTNITSHPQQQQNNQAIPPLVPQALPVCSSSFLFNSGTVGGASVPSFSVPYRRSVPNSGASSSSLDTSTPSPSLSRNHTTINAFLSFSSSSPSSSTISSCPLTAATAASLFNQSPRRHLSVATNLMPSVPSVSPSTIHPFSTPYHHPLVTPRNSSSLTPITSRGNPSTPSYPLPSPLHNPFLQNPHHRPTNSVHSLSSLPLNSSNLLAAMAGNETTKATTIRNPVSSVTPTVSSNPSLVYPAKTAPTPTTKNVSVSHPFSRSLSPNGGSTPFRPIYPPYNSPHPSSLHRHNHHQLPLHLPQTIYSTTARLTPAKPTSETNVSSQAPPPPYMSGHFHSSTPATIRNYPWAFHQLQRKAGFPPRHEPPMHNRPLWG